MTLFGDFVSGQSNVSYTRMRQLLLESGGGLQEGVVDATGFGTDFRAQQRAAGANMSVDIVFGAAWVKIDTGTRNGLSHVWSDITENRSVVAANGTLPRIDQLLLRYNDSAIPTGSGNLPTLEVLTGTATSGATLDNRTGAAALPSDCVRLADILVPAASSSVTTANIRDRRPWARGASYIATGTASGSFTTTSTTPVQLAAGLFDARIEGSGVPIDITISANLQHSVANGQVQIFLAQNGATVRGTVGQSPTANSASQQTTVFSFVPAAGSSLYTFTWNIVTAGTGTMLNTSTFIPVVTYRERVGQNASNT
jgi:hypothetical protein